jgi:hypothetical protein
MNNDKNNFVAPSGTKIFTYTDREKEWQTPHGEECIEETSIHIEKYIGKIHKVFHELVSDKVHIDVHWVKPTPERPYHTLVSSGMSDLPMNIPEHVGSTRHMELMITLPEYWQLDEEAFNNENWYWPVRTLTYLASFPHKYDTYFAWGHTIPNGNPAKPFAEKNCFEWSHNNPVFKCSR